MIPESTKHLDGFIGLVASHVADKEKTSWRAYVAEVDRETAWKTVRALVRHYKATESRSFVCMLLVKKNQVKIQIVPL